MGRLSVSKTTSHAILPPKPQLLCVVFCIRLVDIHPFLDSNYLTFLFQIYDSMFLLFCSIPCMFSVFLDHWFINLKCRYGWIFHVYIWIGTFIILLPRYPLHGKTSYCLIARSLSRSFAFLFLNTAYAAIAVKTNLPGTFPKRPPVWDDRIPPGTRSGVY